MGFLFWMVISALTVIPLLKLLPFFGVKAYWAFGAIIPGGPLVLLWVMAVKLQELERR